MEVGLAGVRTMMPTMRPDRIRARILSAPPTDPAKVLGRRRSVLDGIFQMRVLCAVD